MAELLPAADLALEWLEQYGDRFDVNTDGRSTPGTRAVDLWAPGMRGLFRLSR